MNLSFPICTMVVLPSVVSGCIKECSLLCRAQRWVQNNNIVYNSCHPHPAHVLKSHFTSCHPSALLSLEPQYFSFFFLSHFPHLMFWIPLIIPYTWFIPFILNQHSFSFHAHPPPSHRELPVVLSSFICLPSWATLSLVLVSWSPGTTYPSLLPSPQSQQ